MDLVELLNKAVELKASDVHITVNLSPIARINGKFQKLSQDLLTNNDVYNLVSQITNEEIIHKIDEQGEADFSVSLPNKHRIRVNVYKQRGNYAMAIRIIPNEIPKFEELKLPNAIKEFVNKQKGLVLITGPTGSGKSTLVNEILGKALMKHVYHSKEKPGKYREIKGFENIDKVIEVSQDPIGRTPRSNPVTYTGVFDDIRDLFAKTNEAKMRGYDKGRFSFNVKGGRCEACQGDGVKKISMHFLPDVYVPCEQCEGKRYNEETLQVTYKDKNIYDVLEMTVEDALSFFENLPKIKNKLQTLYDVGLGYVKLGQSATTLSGGEAQRVKLASELQKKATGKTVYILDEPTTGLHSDDVNRLIHVLQRIVDQGDTIIMIEHNLDMIKVADHIVDLGPEGGDGGGTVVVTGTPEKVAQCKNSYTGQFLKKML